MSIFSSKSKMKKMGEQEGFIVHAIEGCMYLLVPKEGANRVIISAHGGRSKNTKDFRVPKDMVLRFYSEDTNTVLDPGFSNFYEKEAAPKEIVYEGEPCFNYSLSKYQGGHNKMGETYDSIAKTINSAAKQRKSLLTDAGHAESVGKTKQANIMKNMAAGHKLAAVLTIRNRVMRGDVSLAFALEQVKAVEPKIVIVDCLFCRWMSGGKDDAVPLVSRR